MSNYIQEIIDNFDEDLTIKVSSPAAKWLFETNEGAKKLKKDRVEYFGSIVAKILWVALRGRPDCGTAVSFLCTRVKNLDADDWKKLQRLICFMKQTINDDRVVGVDDLRHMQTFINSSHAVHDDMMGHTGGIITFGTGVVCIKMGK